MMPGETRPAAPARAAELSRCQGCASLQQNLNEYVDALITLKQKIINTDNLLTEYQKKCDELQFARRENSTLHHQVEQMLQKISPLQQCQEELGALRAELEEKKSSLKQYQDTHQEYTRVKEECLRSDAQKKKLEAKVKKLEEAAVKHSEDFRQLRSEKKTLEKQFKKTQERLDEFSRQKNEKELRHIGTQITRDISRCIDKRRVKLLLKELWLCVNTRRHTRCVVPERPDQHGPGSPAPRAQVGVLQGEGGPSRSVQTLLEEPSGQIQGGHSPEAPRQALAPPSANDSTNFSEQDREQDRCLDEDLQAVVDFFRPPPPLLSPVPSPPLPPTPPPPPRPPPISALETYFGQYSDSDEEDSTQNGVSVESASEDDTSRKDAQHGLPEARLDSLGTVPAQSPAATVGFGTFASPLRGPPAWAPELPRARGRGCPDESERQTGVMEVHRAVQTEPAQHLARGLSPEWALPTTQPPLHTPPVTRPLGEPLTRDSESQLRAWTTTGEASRDLQKCGERLGLRLAGSPEPEGSPMDTRGHGTELSSTSFDRQTQPTSASLCGPQVLPHCSEQSPRGPPTRLELSPEPLQGSRAEQQQEPLLHAESTLSVASENPDRSGLEPPFSTKARSPFRDAENQGAVRKLPSTWHHSWPPPGSPGRSPGSGPGQDPWDHLPCGLTPQGLTPLAPTSVLPNQVSVITKQSRPEPPILDARHAGPSDPCEADRGAPAPRARRTSPEVSTSCRKLDFESSPDACSMDRARYPASRLFSFLSEHFPMPARDPEAHTEPRKWGPFRSPATPHSYRSSVGGRLQAVAGPAARGLPREETFRLGRETRGQQRGPPCTHPSQQEFTELPSQTPCLPSPLRPAALNLPASLHYTGLREQRATDTELESEAPSCSEGEPEPDAPASGAAATQPTESQPSLEVGSLTSALQDWDISTLSDADRLSTSEVTAFLESCQLRDTSSGDSVSECSSKGTLRRGATQGGPPGQTPETQRPDSAEEDWAESEEEDCERPLDGPLSPRALEKLARLLTRLGRELRSSRPDTNGKGAANALLLHMLDGLTGPVRSPSPPVQPIPGGASPTSPAGDQTQCGHESDQTGQESAQTADGGEDAVEEPPQTQTTLPGSAPDMAATFQCQISTVTSEVINVVLSKDQDLVIEKGDHCTIINGLALVPGAGQLIVCDAPGPRDPEPGRPMPAPAQKSPPAGFQDPQCDSHLPCTQDEISSSGQNTNLDKSRLRNRTVRTSMHISTQAVDQDQDLEAPPFASDHTYCNFRLDPSDRAKTRPRPPSPEPAGKAAGQLETIQAEDPSSPQGERTSAKNPRAQTQTVLANADTSTPTDCSSDTLSRIRQEVGPPLPPLLAPLIATPPRMTRSASPVISSSSPASPLGPLSPSCEPAPPRTVLLPLPEGSGRPSPPCESPSPSSATVRAHLPSSPLQFCAATPKHALPVPGRLPPRAPAPSPAPPPENSVRILDTMYPELSARARTLNILKGNLQLPGGPPTKARPAGLTTLSSESTAFVKAGAGAAAGDCPQEQVGARAGQPDAGGGKRLLASAALRSAKRLRLDCGTPEPDTEGPQASLRPRPAALQEEQNRRPGRTSGLGPKETVETHDRAISQALGKLAEAAFDLLPVIRSHVYVGNISRRPVMRDQEKEVVQEFSTTKKHLAECLLHSILSELSTQKAAPELHYTHALCRVYVGVCRQLGDLERARLLCYSLLKEDFPESEKLTLFIANMWHDVFISQSVINMAMQLVARQRAQGEVLNCLRAFLNWEKNAPVDVGIMVSKLLLTIQLCPKTEFQSSEKFGEDLSDSTWEHIFAIDLLCCHQKWVWTHDNIISKELWPVMDKWIKYRKGHANIAHTPDIIVASVLRLIGRLGQLGLKEGFPSAVKNISSVIGMFIQHALDEDIPWGVQLAAVYALCDLSPSNPAEISQILDSWCKGTPRRVPAAVQGCLEEVGSLCVEELP